MNPSGLITEHDAAIDDGRGAPDSRARLVLPNHFAFIRRQAIKVVITAADINLPVVIDRTAPDTDVFARGTEMSTVSHKAPNQLAGLGLVTPHDTVFRRSVDHAVDDCRR